MRELVFLLEEESAKVMLEALQERLDAPGPPVSWRFIVFEGKQDLDHQLNRRLTGYRNPDARFIIIRDQDSSGCLELKRTILDSCPASASAKTLVRIACKELEAFYLGDLSAVAQGLQLPSLARMQSKAKYRNPDDLQMPAAELVRITKNRYQKISGSRAIAPFLALEKSKSPSFTHLLGAIRRQLQALRSPTD